MSRYEPRIALVHDFLLDIRGAERVFGELCRMFPAADVFTAVYDRDRTLHQFADRNIKTSYLQRLHPSARTFRALLPLYPSAIAAMDFSGYDLIVSSSSAWAHGARAAPEAKHVCYCHNPFRYAWAERDAVLRSRGPVSRAALRPIFAGWRRWDVAVSEHVDLYVANSHSTRERIADVFGRDSRIVYPAVELSRFSPGRVGDHYIVLSELMAHKRIAVAIEAFNELRLPLTVVGDGPDARNLQAIAGPTITFTGGVSDRRVAQLLRSARALVVPGTEEFGMAAVEAQASGRPVIALGAGGVLETVQEGLSGCFFDESSPEALATAVAEFDTLAVDPADCVASAERFGPDQFAAGMRRAIASVYPTPIRVPSGRFTRVAETIE